MSDDIPTIFRTAKTFKIKSQFDKRLVDEKLLQITLDRSALSEMTNPAERAERAAIIVCRAMHVAALVAGEEALSVFYGELPAGSDRVDQLRALDKRLWPLVWLYGFDCMKDDPAELGGIFNEIDALQQGDEPYVFARLDVPRKTGQTTRSRWIAIHRLRALQWAEYLQAREVPAADWQHALHAAYGSAWAVIAQWREIVERDLGPEYLQIGLSAARAGQGSFDLSLTESQWRERLNRDAALFKRVRR